MNPTDKDPTNGDPEDHGKQTAEPDQAPDTVITELPSREAEEWFVQYYAKVAQLRAAELLPGVITTSGISSVPMLNSWVAWRRRAPKSIST